MPRCPRGLRSRRLRDGGNGGPAPRATEARRHTARRWRPRALRVSCARADIHLPAKIPTKRHRYRRPSALRAPFPRARVRRLWTSTGRRRPSRAGSAARAAGDQTLPRAAPVGGALAGEAAGSDGAGGSSPRVSAASKLGEEDGGASGARDPSFTSIGRPRRARCGDPTAARAPAAVPPVHPLPAPGAPRHRRVPRRGGASEGRRARRVRDTQAMRHGRRRRSRQDSWPLSSSF